MKILAVGTSGIVVDLHESSPLVFKVFVDEIGSASYFLETRSDLRNDLNQIDKSEKYFVRGHPTDEIQLTEEQQDEFYEIIKQCRRKKGQKQVESARIKPFILVMRRLVPIRDISKLQQKAKRYLEEGIRKLHEAGWMHNDIHSWNILWDPIDEKPKFIDFGEAQKIVNHDLENLLGLFDKSVDIWD